MDRINNFSVYLFMISFIFIRAATCYPTPQNDLIAGKDFLSLFLQENGDVKQNYRNNQRGRSNFPRVAEEEDEGILPIEAMFSSREEVSPKPYSGYGRYRYSQARKIEPFLTTTERIVTETSRGRTTVQMVKSGSKIIFMDEMPISTTTAMPSTTTEIPNETTTTTSHQEVKVISVQMSQSVRSSPEKQPTVTPLNSNSFRSELSIEEDEDHKDSMKSESTNIQTVVAPPVDPNQARSRMQRTQRTQDGVVPYQTVIYHDNSKMDKENSQKAVSYSYVGPSSSDKTKTWKDIDSDFRQKKNSTEEKLPADYWNHPKESEKEPEKLPADFWNHPKEVESVTEKPQEPLPADYWNPPASYDLPANYWKQPASYSLPMSYWNPPTTIASPTTISQSSSIWTPSSTTPGPIPRRITTNKRVVFNQLDKIPYDELNAPANNNDDANVLHNLIGKFSPKNPVVESTTETIVEKPVEMQEPIMDSVKPSNPEDSKVGYVVEGRNYRKYRVEEKTPDGFIVGEYGVVSHNDGNLRGVRYTAESNINPRLIYDALLKFLSL